MRAAALILIAGLVSACTHSLHLHHVGDFDASYASYAEGNWIQAEAEQFVILGFVTQTNYVNEVFDQLKKQCRSGSVQGVQTEYITDHGFFSWTNRIRMQGLCLKKS